MRSERPAAAQKPTIDDVQSGGTAARREGTSWQRRTRVGRMDRALQILDFLREANAPVGGYAIAKALRVPLSTAYLVIDELVSRELLTRHGDGAVWLGPRLYRYGLAYARSLDFLNEAKRTMSDLSSEVGETVQVCSRDGDDVVVLAMATGPGPYRIGADVGTRLPVTSSASGPLLIGHLPEGERLAILQRARRTDSPETGTLNLNALADLAQQALASRLSIELGQDDFRVATVASPICNEEGHCVATIAIVLLEQKVVANRKLYAGAARKATEAVERRLGWRQ